MHRHTFATGAACGAVCAVVAAACAPTVGDVLVAALAVVVMLWTEQ